MRVEVIVNGGTAAGGTREILKHQEINLLELGQVLKGLSDGAPDIVMMDVQIAIPTVHVVSEKKIRSDKARRYAFELITRGGPPKREFVTAAQLRIGYHPAGYGGPHDITSARQGDGTYRTTWYCFDNCD